MKSNFILYDFEKSRERLDDILKAEDANYEEIDTIPSRDKLTFTNGYYVNCSAIFIDIRKSSELPSKYKRPTLAKLYRSFLSEIIAVINGNINCAELNIQGDCVWGIIETNLMRQIDNLFSTSAQCSSLIDVLNYKLKKYGIGPISVGVGLSYGRALMIKGGYNGSGINDVVWMGDVVNEASKLCSYANTTYYDKELMVSSTFFSNLNESNQKLLSWNATRNCYHGDIINLAMNDWLKENEK